MSKDEPRSPSQNGTNSNPNSNPKPNSDDSNNEPLTTRQIAKRMGLARNTVSADLRYLGKSDNSVVTNRSQLSGIKLSRALNTIADEILPYYHSRGNQFPSLRTIFYDLEEKKLIGGDDAPYDYGQLSRYTGYCRVGDKHLLPGIKLGFTKEDDYPDLPIDCFADETREVISNFDDNNPTESTVPIDPDEYIKQEITRLMNAPKNYTGVGNADSPGGYWYKQRDYVEVMIEKFSLKPSFRSFLKDRYVNISINKGYSSISFLNLNCERLKEKVAKYGAEHVHVLYFGDKDPVFRVLQRYLDRLGVPSSIIEKIALTQEQINQFHIPTTTITGDPIPGKKKGDSRARSWIARNGNQTAHIDAFIASKRDTELEKIVQDCVDQYHDKKIYEEMKKQYDGSHILEIPEDLDNARRRMYYKISKAFEPGWIATHKLRGLDNYAFAEKVIQMDIMLYMEMMSSMARMSDDADGKAKIE